MSSLEKVAPGQRVRSLPAGDWNAFIDAARSHRSGQLGVSTDADAPEFSPVIALVKNATGGHLPRYSVLGIAGPVADPQSQSDQFRNQITLVGVAPTAAHCGRFVILKDDLAPGFVGEAVIAGACIVQVIVPPGGDDLLFANILPNNTTALQATVVGGARILWRESGEGLKWGVVRLADAPQAIVHFELTGDLELGGSAPAKILTWDGSDWVPGSATITVRDWHDEPGMWQAYAGYKGLALRNACLDRYEVVWMETPARSIEFTLATAMTGGEALASVTNYYLQGKAPNGTVPVYDALGNYPRALVGAKGKARWNDRQRRYEVVECDQMAIILSSFLAGDMCPSSSTGGLSGGSVLTFPPYGQSPMPPPSQALNRYHLAGRSGDACLVVWDQTASDWVIAQVAHHEIEVPLKYRFYDGYLQAKHRKIAVMYCADETDWRNEIKLEEAEVVDSVRFTGCGPTSPGDAGGNGGTDAGGNAGGTTASNSATSGSAGCGAIEFRTAKAYFFAAPVSQAWANVLSFQEQAVLVAAAGSGNCIVFQEATVCSPCIGTADTTRVCATVGTTVTCQCTCSGGDSGGGSGSGSYSDCSCSCVCQASSSIIFG